MEENTKSNSAKSGKLKHRPPFTVVDWIIAAFSIALLTYILINLPAP